MVNLVPDNTCGVLFLLATSQGCTPLTKNRLVSEFHCFLVAAGIADAATFKGHSFRRGTPLRLSTMVFQVNLFPVNLYGDWMSDAYKVFLEFSVQSNIIFARQLHSAAQSIIR